MDFLTNIALNLMPVVQDPAFKKGCYGLALITIILLIFLTFRTIIKRRKEKEGRVITDRNSPGITFISILFFMSLSVGILADITEWNEPGKITVLDSGEIITKPKPYLSVGKKKTAVYDRIKEIRSTEIPESPEPVDMKFSDSGIAETDYKFDLKLPEDPEMILAIHEKYGSQEKMIKSGAKPLISEAIKIGAMLLNSEECSDVKERKLAEFVNDQLLDGLYIVEKGEIRKDDNGEPVRKKHDFSEFKVKFAKFKIENFNKEEIVRKLEFEKDKIAKELRKFEKLKFDKIPFVDELQIVIENEIKYDKKLSKDQKALIITSLKNAKEMIIKLKARAIRKLEKKEDSDRRY